MQSRCTSSDRDMIIYVIERETGQTARHGTAPDFLCEIGNFSITRDGVITADGDAPDVFSRLAGLGLCDAEAVLPPLPADAVTCPMAGHTGVSLVNLVHILSARQVLLNRALGVHGAFAIRRDLIEHLGSHPPVSREDFLRAVYGWEAAHRGVPFDRGRIRLTGLEKGRRIPPRVRRQLAERMVSAALTQNRAKPFTRSVRDKKTAMRTWLNTLGMQGEAYAEARAALLRDLPGKEVLPRG